VTRFRRIDYPDGSWRVVDGRVRWPDDDGVFGDNYPYTSERHAPLNRVEAGLIVAGVACFVVACLFWWPW
jgi:hypothetical protein